MINDLNTIQYKNNEGSSPLNTALQYMCMMLYICARRFVSMALFPFDFFFNSTVHRNKNKLRTN